LDFDTSQKDAVILGASKLEHFTDNMKYCQNAQNLPEEVLQAFENAWCVTKVDSSCYFKANLIKH